jgi:hypothetical protein
VSHFLNPEREMNQMKLKACVIVMFLALLAALPGTAHADNVTLSLAPVSAAPGTTVTVDGTIASIGSTTFFLNNEDFTLGSSFFLNGDTTDFFLNAPLSLDGGTNTGTIALFTFDIANGTPAGTYAGNFLDVIGGPGANDQNLLASTEFAVTVTPVTATPEPGSLVLIATGLLLLIALALIKK